MMTFRPFGPSVTFTALASFEIPRFIASRASWSNAICLAAICYSSGTVGVWCWLLRSPPVATGGLVGSLDDAHHVAFVHDEDFTLDLGPAVLELVAGPG